jgi:fatty acid desaturase
MTGDHDRSADPQPGAPERARESGPPAQPATAEDERRPRRPMIERVGLALIALTMAAAFGGVAVAAWVGGELFLAVMGGVGCLMTAWVGGLTALRR